MIEVAVPQGIEKFEVKTIGPFTTREAICCGIALVTGYLAYNFTGDLSRDTRIIIVFFIALPFILAGKLKIYGMNLEEYLLTILTLNILAPKYRTYKAEIIDMVKEEPKRTKKEQEQFKKASKKKRKKNKKNKELMAYR